MSNGFLYVLMNAAMPGLVKVGKTTRDPTNRVAELSAATGVPSAFMLVYFAAVSDCHTAEAWVHDQLARKGYRPNAAREFFTAPVHEAIDLVIEARDAFSGTVNRDPDAAQHDHQIESADGMGAAWDLLELGDALCYGTDDHLIDKPRALRCYEQAAAMGLDQAAARAGTLYHYGADKVRVDLPKALAMHRKADELGYWTSIADIASIFCQSRQRAAAGAHWERFFEAARIAVDSAQDASDREATYLRAGTYGRRYIAEWRLNDVNGTVPLHALVFFQRGFDAWWARAIENVTGTPDEELLWEYKNERSFLVRKLQEAKGTISSSIR